MTHYPVYPRTIDWNGHDVQPTVEGVLAELLGPGQQFMWGFATPFVHPHAVWSKTLELVACAGGWPFSNSPWSAWQCWAHNKPYCSCGSPFAPLGQREASTRDRLLQCGASRFFDWFATGHPDNIRATWGGDVGDHEYYEVKISAEDQIQADAILKSLLKKRLVTGGQFISSPARFLWEGQITDMPDYVTITSYTVGANIQALMDDVRRTSDEEVPMVTFVAPVAMNSELQDWIDATLGVTMNEAEGEDAETTS
jgi:uncharacterized protein involved in tolerance to divalent cations